MNRVQWTGLVALVVFVGIVACNNTFMDEVEAKKNAAVEKARLDSINKFVWKRVTYDSTKKYIYLTFDDGPQNGTTTCVELCGQLGIKASFFMVGLHAAGKSDGSKIVSMIRQSYPHLLLANHSYTHAKEKYVFFYKHPEMAKEDFLRNQESLDIPFKIVRLPGNSAWVRNGEVKSTHLVKDVCNLLDSAGYNVIGWDVEWNFNRKTAFPVESAEKFAAVVDSVLAKNHTHTQNHIVILTHDRMFRDPAHADSLAHFISLLKQHPDYVFETVDHYPGLKRLN